MPSPASLPRSGILALVALCAVWGYTWVILKEGVRYADPWDYATLRTVPGALLLFAIAAWRSENLALRSPRHVFMLGLWQTAAFNGLVSWALVAGAAGKTAVLVYTMPFWTLLIAWPALGERIRGLQWLAVALSAAGLLLVLEPWSLQGSFAANVLAVLTGVSWAVAAVLTRRWRSHLAVGTFALTAWQMLLGGLVLWVISFFLSARPVQWTPYFGFLLAYATIFGTVLGWALWFYVLKLLPAGVAGLAVMAVPAIGVLSSRIQLGEQPGPVESAGMLLIVASLAVLSWSALRRRG
ncbi:MAG: EamA family transporter [Burkholderiales bacterium]|jgi:drug/metabolite transporter (DMT)-like permease|nr:EamA family transporter [Burkholderiales bacterium]